MGAKLSQYITDDLKSRILSGEDVPENLGLIDIANEYDVSITPVRRALAMLEEQGLVERLPNRRLRVVAEAVGIGADIKTVDEPRQPADWAEILLDEVMRASLASRSTFLRESPLAEKYGVGRSIIRQAFHRFAGAGLLEHVARKGWLVHHLSESDLDAYLEVREALELRALRLAVPHLHPDRLGEILEESSHALDNSLHAYLIECSDNRYIKDFFRQYVARYYTKLLHFAAPEVEIVDEMTVQHREILKLLLERKWDEAQRALSHHIRVQRTIFKKLIDESTRGTLKPRSEPALPR